MRKLIFIISLFLTFVFIANAQKDKSFTADTVQGNENIYFTYSGGKLNSFDLLAGFYWTSTTIAGGVDAVHLQGSEDGSNWTTIMTETTPSDGSYFSYDRISTSVTLTTTTTTNANTSAVAYSIDTCGGVADTTTLTAADTSTSTTTSTLTQTSHVPQCNYYYYRLWVDGGAGDTVVFNPVNFNAKLRED